jgi:trehalose 6-phosphate phosphatase
MVLPELDRTSALFLDIDGTLLDIAAQPEEVVVPQDLPALLERLHRDLDGALAIVSGRSLSDIDRLFDPFVSGAAGEHGAVVRHADGRIEKPVQDVAVPSSWREALRAASAEWPGVRIEGKPHGVTVHFRQAPRFGDEVWRVARALVPEDHPTFRLLPARQAVEIGHRAVSKGSAVERLMAQPPFRGRRPIFIGDDITDEAGIGKARDLGGLGLLVGDAFGGEPARVRAWLAQGAQRLGGNAPTGALRAGGAP